MKEKHLLFSVTKKDLIRQTFRSGGKGGQNQNKVESGVRLIHPPSGARGEGREYRDQPKNERAAFERLFATSQFQTWIKLEAARRMHKPIIETPDQIKTRINQMVDNDFLNGNIIEEQFGPEEDFV